MMEKAIGFGIDKINLPTPANITIWVRVITITLGIFLAWMNTSTLIGDGAQEIISSLGGLVIVLINALAPLFGIKINPDEQVAAKDVQSMKI